MPSVRHFCSGWLAWSCLSLLTLVGAEPVLPAISFANDVAPILERRCLECHGQRQPGGEEPKGGLSLTTRRAALAGGDSGAAIVPGKSAASPLIEQITPTATARAEMPKRREPLTKAQVAALTRWINEGAEWPEAVVLSDKRFEAGDWWSFQPLVRPAVPKLDPALQARVRNPIDAFVLAKLHEKGLVPTTEADRRVLIRRLSFDLLGLPPTPEEIEAFLADADPLAYEKLADRYLASPHYGERWARHWLDVVHYGETHGYDKDQPRPNAWPYRDYVIRSLNADKPYARFIEEQLAGDALYPDTRDGIEALGFIAAGPWDFIGHAEVPETKIDGKIARHLDRDDMAANTMQTFASLTVQCAQCHDHKFDPITQRDYYQVQAVFAALDRADHKFDADPAVARRRGELTKTRQELTAKQTQLATALAQRGGEELQRLDKSLAALAKPEPDNSPRAEAYGYHSQIMSQPDATKWVQVDLGRSLPIHTIVLAPCRDQFNQIGDGFGFPVRFKVELADDADFQKQVTLFADHAEKDVPNPGIQPQSFPAKAVSARYVRVTALKLAPRMNDFIFALAELLALDEQGQNLAANAMVRGLDSIEAPPRWRQANLTDGYFPGESAAKTIDLAKLTKQRAEFLASLRTPEESQTEAELTRRLHETEQSLTSLPAQQTCYIAAVHHGSGSFSGTGSQGGKPRPIYLLARGNVTQPGSLVEPGTIAALAPLDGKFALPADAPESARRVALAKWLTDRRNPLTWRSIANRLWQYHLGRGIVETPNDFGRNGGLPAHPELLDWLAVEFRDGGQSWKQLHRLIVSSAVYRQASTGNAANERLDAGNRFAWRANRRRIEAEAIRDGLLSISGKLDRTMYGPGFRDFVIEKPEHSPHYEYHLHDPEDPLAHRRSIYRMIVRSQPQPFLTTFDCADPSAQVAVRNESLSPTQALALLNNGLTISLAKHTAVKLKARDQELSAQARRLFYEATGRPPNDAELAALAEYAERHGLAALCRAVFNLNEFLFVD